MIRRFEGPGGERVARRIAETMLEDCARHDENLPAGALHAQAELDIDIIDEEIFAHAAERFEDSGPQEASRGDGEDGILLHRVAEPAPHDAPFAAHGPI